MEENQPSYEDRLMGNTQRSNMDQVDVNFEDGDLIVSSDALGLHILLSEKIESQMQASWQYTMVVNLLGQDIGYKLLCNKIQSLWNPSSIPKVIDMEDGFILIKFDNDRDMYTALLGGPWVILGHYLTVQRWCPSFRASTGKVSRTMVWIRYLTCLLITTMVNFYGPLAILLAKL